MTKLVAHDSESSLDSDRIDKLRPRKSNKIQILSSKKPRSSSSEESDEQFEQLICEEAKESPAQTMGANLKSPVQPEPLPKKVMNPEGDAKSDKSPDAEM